MRTKLFHIFFILCTSLVVGDVHEIGIPFIANFSPRDYQASNQNWCITQNQQGLVYIANGKGVLEFDGSHWRLIPLSNNGAALSLTTAPDNTIFVGGKNELGYLAADETGSLTYHSLLQHLKMLDRNFGDVWETIAIKKSVYFRTSEKLYRFTFDDSLGSPHITTWTPKNHFHFSFNKNGVLIIRDVGHGLFFVQDDSLHFLPGGEQFADESVYSFLPMPDGSALVVSKSQGLYKYANSFFSRIENPVSKFIKQERAIHTITLANGYLAMATNVGVLFVDDQGRIVHHVNKLAGLRDNTVWYLLQDSQGGVWCALNNGVARIELPSPLTLFDDRTKLDGTAQDIIRHNGTLYVATSPLGVFYLNPDATSPFSQFQHVKDIPYQSWRFAEMNGRLLVAATRGIFEIRGSRAIRILPENESLDAACLFAPGDATSRLFVGLFDGLAVLKYQKNRWLFENRIEEVNDEIRSIIADTTGALWLGTRSNGIYRLEYSDSPHFQLTNLEHFSTNDGLPAGQTFAFLIDGRIVVTTENRGLYSFNASSKTFLPELGFGSQFSDGSQDVEIIAQNNSKSTIWFGSEESGRIDQLEKIDGQYVIESNALKRLPVSAIRAIYPDVDNVLWISTNDGLFRYDASIDKNIVADYRAFIRRVSISPDSLIYGGEKDSIAAPQIPHKYNSLKFELSAVSFDAVGTLEFQTFLHGFDKSWSNWTTGTTKEYTNLPPGRYTFHVRARNIYGTKSQPDRYSFRILPPFYRTWFAYGFYALLFAAVAFGIDRLQRRRLLRRAQERTRIALLEAENERRAQELEQARHLQISMLPKELPHVPDANIAVFMKTATEVGGDYYDFIVKDGEFTGAIGDATGHGLNAGMMVSIIKGFFVSEAANMLVVDFIKKCNAALKKMNLNRIYMALTIFKIKNKKLILSSAGMPPVYHYRSAENKLEEISLTGMPLGAVAEFDYSCQEIELQAGDTLFFMSDGFPELFNPDHEMIGYDQVPAILRDLIHKPPQDIVTELVTFAKGWAQDRPNEDDITFVVVKIK